MLGRDAPSDPGNAAPMTFPSYVLEHLRRLGEKEADLRRDQVRALSCSVGRVPQHCALLRECADVVEASVLALGVSVAHTLILRLSEVREGLEEVKACWSTLLTRSQEISRQREEAMAAMSTCYTALLDKSQRTERELRQLVAERDRKDAALDKAVAYVHCVVAERAAWQQKHGFNAADLPLEEGTFSDQCSTALSSLYAARDALKTATPSVPAATANAAGSAAHSAVAPPISLNTNTNTATVSGRNDNLTASPTKRAPASVHAAAVSSAQNAHLVAASASARRPYVSSVDTQHTLSARWRSIQDARHATFVPSTRLRYVPPNEEVNMLREVLSMGVGSSVLMRDVEAQRAALAQQQRRVGAQWREGRAALQSLKRELVSLKVYIRSILDQGIPFLYHRQELMRHLNTQLESEVQRRLRQSRQSRQLGTSLSRRGTAPDMGDSKFSDLTTGERASHRAAQGDEAAAFSNKLPLFANRMSIGDDAQLFVFPPRQSDATAFGDDDDSTFFADTGGGDQSAAVPPEQRNSANSLYADL